MSGSEVVASNTPVSEQVAQEPASSIADASTAPAESQSVHEPASSSAEVGQGSTEIKEVSVGDLEREVSTDASNLCATHSRELIAPPNSSRRSVRTFLRSLDHLL